MCSNVPGQFCRAHASATVAAETPAAAATIATAGALQPTVRSPRRALSPPGCSGARGRGPGV